MLPVLHAQNSLIVEQNEHLLKLEQQRKYTKCKEWALECGLSESEFELKLKRCPPETARGQSGLPICLKIKKGHCSAWQHVKRECMDVAIRKAAADAGWRIGGEQIAVRAEAEVSELMSFETGRTERWNSLPKNWRSMGGYNLTADDCKTSSGIKPLPTFFELWLRDEAAARMGHCAERSWREYAGPRGVSQRAG